MSEGSITSERFVRGLDREPSDTARDKETFRPLDPSIGAAGFPFCGMLRCGFLFSSVGIG